MMPRAEPVSPVQPPRRWVTAERTASGLALLISLVISLPLITIIVIALAPAPGVWPHLLSTTLPYSLQQTLLLMIGVALLTLVMGGGTAWLITMYRFPGRDWFDWLMILPLALPTYISAYCYSEFLEYSGPVQQAIRAVGGFTSFQDYWFPSVRSLGGAILILSVVLYPYVYMTARASFSVQSTHVLEVARTLGRSGAGALYSVALPLARPALAAGVSLALMECLNDIGAVSYLGVSTLTLSVYDAWIQRSSLAGAAQLALVMFVFVVALLALERYGRRNVRFQTGRTDRPISRTTLPTGKSLLAAFACFLPFAFGFLIPVSVLLEATFARSVHTPWRDYLSAAQNSVMLSAIAAVVVIVCAVVIAAAIRLTKGRVVTAAARTAALGYAIPGTVIGLGLIIPLAAFDNALSAFFNEMFGFRTGLLLSGSAFALALAYTIRFMAVGFGAIDAGWQRLSPNLDAASRTLGASPLRMLKEVHIPLLRPAIGAAALLVFVDCMKELSATLLLRPFNFETLATHIYVYASQEQFEKSAMAALTIVAAGLVPLLLLHRTLTTPQSLATGSRTAGTNPNNP